MFTRTFFEKWMDEYDSPEMNNIPLESLYIKIKVVSETSLASKIDEDTESLLPRELLKQVPNPPNTDRLDDAVARLVRN